MANEAPRVPELGPGELMDMYYLMILSRTFEERVSTLYKQGRIQAGVFSGIGQEAITIGTCYGLEDEDFVAPAHRDLGVFLVKGVPPRAIMAQLYGKADGLSRGKDSALHAGEPELNVFGTTSIPAPRAVIVHEDWRRCGFGAEIAAILAEEAMDFLDGPILRVASQDTPIPFASSLEEAHLPNAAKIVDAVHRLMKTKKEL